MESFESVGDYLKVTQPSDPVICERPHAATRAAAWFLENFPGIVLYAVKANPSPVILDALHAAGVRDFDVSSPAELELLARYPDARVYCMNPVKHPDHIRQAYFEHGVRDFALDCADELDKILACTDGADDLALHVRIAVSNDTARVPLTGKYGVTGAEAAALLVAARLHAERLGVCFHVGSQAMNPASYARAISHANHLISQAGVILDSLDVGGGFPAAYPGIEPPALSAYMRTIEAAFDDSLTSWTCELLCEPGRALVAESASVLANVTLRKHDALYLNDGAYGALFDAAHLNFPYPVRAWRDGRRLTGPLVPFRFYGPTCDSIDAMAGPFMLPADIAAGDYIEIGQLGAYGDTMRTDFNGFGKRRQVTLTDEPMLSLFSAAAGSRAPIEIEIEI